MKKYGIEGVAGTVLCCLFVLVIVGLATNAEAASCEGYIPRDTVKTFAVVPGGTLDICYYPLPGSAAKLGAQISLWAYWDDEQPPDVKVDVYYLTTTNINTYWTYLFTIDAEPWWRYGPTLWLVKGMYVFSISTDRQATVNLYVRKQ